LLYVCVSRKTHQNTNLHKRRIKMPPKSRRKSEVTATPPEEDSPKKETKEEKKIRLAEERAKAKAWAEERKKKLAGLATVSSPSPKKAKSESVLTEMMSPVGSKKRSSSRRSSTEPSSASTRVSSKKVKRKKDDSPPKSESKGNESDESSTEVKKPSTKRRKIMGSPKKEETPAVAVETTATTASVPIESMVSPRPSVTKKSKRQSPKKMIPAPVAIAPIDANIIMSPTKKRVASPKKKKTVVIQEAPIVVASLEEHVEEEEEEEKGEAESTTNNFGKKLLFPILITVLGFIVLALHTSSNEPKPTHLNQDTHDEISKGSCFLNYGFQPRTETKMVNQTMEDGLIQEVESIVTIPLDPVTCENPTACPQNARCEGGVIVDCLDDSSLMWKDDNGSESSIYVLNEEKNACVLSPDALKGMLSIHSTLVNLTLEQICASRFGLGPTCSVSSQDYKNNGGKEIMFDINVVATMANISSMDNFNKSMSLLKSDESLSVPSSILSLVGKDDIEYIGLSSDFVQNQLPIPFSCWLRTLGWNLMYAFGNFMYFVIGILLNIGWDIFSSKPIPTFLVAVLVYILVWIRGRRLKNADLRKRVVEVQKLAYDKLMLDCDEGEGYAALHLRDEIAHELYPEPCYERKFLVNDVWPRVVNAVRVDNRVTKTRKSIGGKNLEWWEWVVEPARRSRRSLETSAKKKEE
jgi:hypothetical protein